MAALTIWPACSISTSLNVGDTITLTTRLGTRTYSVTSVNKISETDNSLV